VFNYCVLSKDMYYQGGRSGIRIPGRFKSKTEKLAPAVSLVSVHHLRPRAGLVSPVSV